MIFTQGFSFGSGGSSWTISHDATTRWLSMQMSEANFDVKKRRKKLRPRCNDLQIIVLHLKLFLCTFPPNMACMYKRNRDRQQAKPGRLRSSRFQQWDLRE